MATTVSYTASMCTRKTGSSSNAKNGIACQEFYDSSYNYVGILCFSGMNLSGKVITGISLTIEAAKAGYGAGSSKTVFMRKANYQNSIASGVTGYGYAGDALGTFDGSFYGNTTYYQISGSLLNNMAAYISQGKNTFTLYNPDASASSHGYSYNYFQLTGVTISVTYEEAVSAPTVSSSSVNLGSAVTIYTNRVSSSTTHTVRYSFGGSTGVIATGVGASVSWTPPLSLASQIPNAVSGICTITCQSYNGGSLTGTRTCTLTLNVPSTVVPTISSVSVEDINTTVVERIGAFVRTQSRLAVAITAAGAGGSTISSYRTSLDGVTYTSATFTASKVLMTAGDMTMTVVVTDSRGRTASYSTTFFVMDYNSPSIRQFKAERCNSDGTEAKVDGTNVRYSLQSSVTPLDNQNALSCVVYYKLNTATAWSVAETLPVTSYNLSAVDKLLEQTFDDLASYDLKVRLTDYFYYAEQAISIGTKGVIMDILSDGTGIAFGKVAEESEHVEFGWPLSLSEPLAISEGGTGADTAVGACNAIGAVKKAGDAMTGNLTIFGQLYPSLLLQPYNNDTTNRTVFEGSYVGASSFASWEDGTGNNRRMLEVRTKAYASALDNAVLLRTAENGNWNQYRVFHAGMESGVPIANGGTGATTAANARINLGTNNASNLTTGTVNAARLPFKVQYGQTTITGVSWTTVSLSGFTSTPTVIVSYAGNPSSSGISVLKTGNESASSFQVCMAGSSGSGSRKVNWIAIGK